MGGSELQLQAVGIQDLYLVSKPDINIFKYSYYRYVNFATETLSLPLNQLPNFGSTKVSVNIPKKGHLLSKLYLRIKLPELEKIDGTYICWSDTLGYSIFNGPIELEIGGVIVDRLYPVCLDMLDELSTTTNKVGMNKMILKSDIYRSALYNASKSTELMIPLDFWFTKQYSNALPLISMNNQDISINFFFKDFNNVINYDGSIGTSPASIIDSNIYAEYIFLDNIILDTFQKQKHQYVIQQMVYHGDEYITENQTTFSTKINFQNPCKELLFACIDNNNIDNNNYFNYSRRSDQSPIISHASLIIDGRHRFNNDFLPENVFREYFPNNVHSVIPNKHMYIMPFCIMPENSGQPSGSINLSKFDEVSLSLKLNKNNPECEIHIYGLIYNIVTIENGSLTFEFMN